MTKCFASKLGSRLLLCAVFASPCAHANEQTRACTQPIQDSQTLIEHINRQLTDSPIWSAAFQQQNHVKALSFPLQSSGNVHVDRTRGVVWQMLEPVQDTVVLTEKGINLGAGTMDASKTIATLLIEIISGDFNNLTHSFTMQGCLAKDHWQIDLSPISVHLRERIKRMSFAGNTHVEHMSIEQTGDTHLAVKFDPPVVLTNLDKQIDELLNASQP